MVQVWSLLRFSGLSFSPSEAQLHFFSHRLSSTWCWEIGDYIVHSNHGIGKYIGIKTLTKNGLRKDYLVLEYKECDKLYLPVEKIEFISKYSTKDGVKPKLNKLGTLEWVKTKQKVKLKVEQIAGELINLYAKREASQGFKFSADTEEQYKFENEFE